MVVWVQSANVGGSIIDLYPDYPTGLNTGVQQGVTLTSYSGSNVLSTPGAVLQNLDIVGTLIVTAPNVTIRNCRVTGLTTDIFFVIDMRDGSSNCLIEHCNVIGPGVHGPCSAAIIGDNSSATDSNMTVRYCNVQGGEHGIVMGYGAGTVIGNYLHDPDIDPSVVGGDKHVGGVSFKGGQDGVLVRGNRIVCNNEGTSDIFMQAQFAPINNVLIDGNLCGTNPGFNLYCEDRFGFTATNITITNNVFYTGAFGVFAFNITISPQPTISNNVTMPNKNSNAMFGEGAS